MVAVYDHTPGAEKERLKKKYPRGVELVEAIERDLAHVNISNVDKDNRFSLVQKPNKYAVAYAPDIEPPIEIRVTFLLADDGNALVKVFQVIDL